MNTIPDKDDYVRYTLYSAGITPTDEDVAQIYATGYPRLAVDSLVAAYQVHRKNATEFMESMQQLQNLAGHAREQIRESGFNEAPVVDGSITLPITDEGRLLK